MDVVYLSKLLPDDLVTTILNLSVSCEACTVCGMFTHCWMHPYCPNLVCMSCSALNCVECDEIERLIVYGPE